MIALANDKQRENLLDGKHLVKFLLRFEQELENPNCLIIQTRKEFIDYDLTDTRNLLISLGIFKPKIDTISRFFPNGLPFEIPVMGHLSSKPTGKLLLININPDLFDA